MNASTTYALLEKPFFAPPAWLFGPVWGVLYVLIAATFGYVFYRVARGTLPVELAAPFALNLLANLAFTPVEFMLTSQILASALVIAVFGTLVWAMVAIWPYAQWVTYALVPYLCWVGYAAALQLSITYLNF